MPYIKNKIDLENEYHENQEECHITCIDEAENVHMISWGPNGTNYENNDPRYDMSMIGISMNTKAPAGTA